MVNVTNYTDGITLVQFKIVQEHNLKERLVDVKTSSVDLELFIFQYSEHKVKFDFASLSLSCGMNDRNH